MKKRILTKAVVLAVLGTILLFSSAVQAKGILLKQGMQGGQVSTVQNRLKDLGYFNQSTTGYFGEITKSAVMKFQKAKGLYADGVVGDATWNKLFSNSATRTTGYVSRSGNISRDSGLIPWSEVKNIFSIGSTATVIDVRTGVKFRVKRTFGYNHADSETLTADDTAKMKSVFGGQWTWNRRPIIVIVDGDGRWIAASMAGMPHAGTDSVPVDAWVSNRSEGYGYGQNLDAVKGNNMDGHFDIHFLDSRTHGTNKIDPQHQAAVKEAAEYIRNYQ